MTKRLVPSIAKRRAVYGGGRLSRMKAKKFAEKLYERCHEGLGAYDGPHDELRDGESFIRLSPVFSADRNDGSYNFTVSERVVRVGRSGTRTDLEWEAEISVTPDIDVFIERKTGDVPEEALGCALASVGMEEFE